jgi:hypothetical protein
MRNGGTLPSDAVPANPSLRLVRLTSSHQLDRRAFEFDRHLVARSIEVLTTEVKRARLTLNWSRSKNVFEAPIAKQLLKEACKFALDTQRVEKAAYDCCPGRE